MSNDDDPAIVRWWAMTAEERRAVSDKIDREMNEAFLRNVTVSQIQRGMRWTYLVGAPEPKPARPQITRDVVEAIRLDTARPLRVVAAAHGLSIASVSRIRNGKAWK